MTQLLGRRTRQSSPALLYTIVSILTQLASAQEAVPAGGAGSTDTNETAGEGSDSSSWNLSPGAIAGIAVGVGLLIVGVFVLWVLWFLKKKRGWEVRKSISRVSRRLTGRMDNTSRTRRTTMRQGIRMDSPPQSRSRDRDLEKGPTIKVQAASPQKNTRDALVIGAPPPKKASKPATAHFG